MNTASLDIVYFVKDGTKNDELRYSLRSVCQNMPFNRVWIFGGCPQNIVPDVRVRVDQTGKTKWDKVRNMYRLVCENKEITNDFIMFNDDFFIMKPVDFLTPFYRYSLTEYITALESKNRNHPNEYTKLLRECRDELAKRNKSQLSYELHIPFIFNKGRLLSLLDNFPNQHCARSMYGNIYGIGGVRASDVKIFSPKPEFDYKNTQFLSTDDSVINVNNDVWRWIQRQFPTKSKYEL